MAELGERDLDLGTVLDAVLNGGDEEQALGVAVDLALVREVDVLVAVEAPGDLDQVGGRGLRVGDEGVEAGPLAAPVELALVLPARRAQ